MRHGMAHGTGNAMAHSPSPYSLPPEMQVVIHPQVEGDRLTAVSFPAMNELQR